MWWPLNWTRSYSSLFFITKRLFVIISNHVRQESRVCFQSFTTWSKTLIKGVCACVWAYVQISNTDTKRKNTGKYHTRSDFFVGGLTYQTKIPNQHTFWSQSNFCQSKAQFLEKSLKNDWKIWLFRPFQRARENLRLDSKHARLLLKDTKQRYQTQSAFLSEWDTKQYQTSREKNYTEIPYTVGIWTPPHAPYWHWLKFPWP
jgi:hypothetical protein